MKFILNSFLFFALFLLSLLSHGVIPWLIGLILVGFYIVLREVKYKQRDLWLFFGLFSFLIVFALKFQLYDVYLVPDEYQSSFIVNFFMYSCFLVIFIMLRAISSDQKTTNAFVQASRYLLYLHVGIFYFQFTVLLFTGYFIDFVEPFTGELTRYRSFDPELHEMGFYRCTGFYVEPSTYTSAITMLIIIQMLNGEVKLEKGNSLALASMFLSFSTAGIIVAFLLLVFYLRGNLLNKKALVVLGSFIMVCILMFWPFILQLYESQLVKFDSSSGARFGLLDFIVDRSVLTTLWGYGPFAVEQELMEMASPDYGKGRVASLNGAGMLVFLLLRMGLLGGALFFLMLFTQIKNYKFLYLFVVASITKVAIFHPIFLLYFAFANRKIKG